MTNPYFANVTNYPQNTQTTNSKSRKNTALFLTGATVGGIAGGYLGYRQNPIITKDGCVKDSFAHSVFKSLPETPDNTYKKIYDKNILVLEKLKNIKNTLELKNLATENPKIFSEIKINIDNIDKSNLSENITAIEDFIKAKNKNEIINFKNNIQKIWNPTNKKFENAGDISDELFNTIKKSATKIRISKILKSAGVGALVGGILMFLPKLISSSNKN